MLIFYSGNWHSLKYLLKMDWRVVLSLCSLVNVVDVLDNGLARTPPMGWMSWGYYMCGDDCAKYPEKCLDERLILNVADSFYSQGYQEAGFEYIIIDDCWSEKKRDEYGRLVADRRRFPNGMKYIADYIHARGLKFGMYTNIAKITCMQYPGSRGYFELDARTFAEWDIDFLKVDGCFVAEDYLNTAYIDLGKELNKTGRPIMYSCSWPYYIQFIIKHEPNYEQVSKHCNLWRNYHDVVTSWSAVRNIMEHYQENYDSLSLYHGPGHWNDPDMLIFGTGSLKPGQSRVHLSVYAMLSAPLLLSCDMKRIQGFEKDLLLNMDLIALGQDPLGIMARPYELQAYVTLWVKPRLPRKGDRYPSYSFLLVNLDYTDVSVSFSPAQYGLNCTDGYTVMNIFSGEYIMNVTLDEHITATVKQEDAVLYTLFPL